MMPNGNDMPMTPPPGAGGPQAGGPQGAPDPQMVKGEIVKMLVEAKRVATQAGLNWDDILAAVGGGGGGPQRPAPRMPMG